MGFLKAIQVVATLFSTTCLFCWILTAHWIFGPIVTVAFFCGGIMFISLLGVSLMEQE